MFAGLIRFAEPQGETGKMPVRERAPGVEGRRRLEPGAGLFKPFLRLVELPEPDQRIQMRGRQPDAGAEMLRSRLVVVQALADRAEVVGQRGIVRGTLDRLLEKAPGFGMAPKVTLVALTTFFPLAVSLLEGYASTDKAAADLLRSMGASRWQIFRHLEFPAALGYFFSGLRVSVSYAVVGAVISEWLGGFEGLGVYMTRVRKAYAYDKMFAVIIVIVVVSLLLMALVTALRRLVMPWEAYEKIERND